MHHSNCADSMKDVDKTLMFKLHNRVLLGTVLLFQNDAFPEINPLCHLESCPPLFSFFFYVQHDIICMTIQVDKHNMSIMHSLLVYTP